ncbi:hypothetical protein CRG98_044494 [Punica granatum]|uniref:Embryo sac development arrest 6 n=1 Tax=Punica granatum TaxID=22663 RepID=A0A2I0HTR0_PUNGR|nr:hypothetical protein CRG98_044494 [Punica granatum]
MAFPPRRILTPVASRKRKERESLLACPEAITAAKPSAHPPAPAQAAAKPPQDNRLLAGYMAYEFLTRGTLLGQRLDPARAEAVQVGPGLAEAKRTKPEAEPSGRKDHGSYAEVASILKTEGAHIPGIVNPTQLARWIQL